jgi:hypothetical protein
MRYHWGLAIGHKYCHDSAQIHHAGNFDHTPTTASDGPDSDRESRHTGNQVDSRASDYGGEGELDTFFESGSDGSEPEGDEPNEPDGIDNIELLAMDEMYGSHELECYDL